MMSSSPQTNRFGEGLGEADNPAAAAERSSDAAARRRHMPAADSFFSDKFGIDLKPVRPHRALEMTALGRLEFAHLGIGKRQ
jgi:hypothetical protein